MPVQVVLINLIVLLVILQVSVFPVHSADLDYNYKTIMSTKNKTSSPLDFISSILESLSSASDTSISNLILTNNGNNIEFINKNFNLEDRKHIHTQLLKQINRINITDPVSQNTPQKPDPMPSTSSQKDIDTSSSSDSSSDSDSDTETCIFIRKCNKIPDHYHIDDLNILFSNLLKAYHFNYYIKDFVRNHNDFSDKFSTIKTDTSNLFGFFPNYNSTVLFDSFKEVNISKPESVKSFGNKILDDLKYQTSQINKEVSKQNFLFKKEYLRYFKTIKDFASLISTQINSFKPQHLHPDLKYFFENPKQWRQL